MRVGSVSIKFEACTGQQKRGEMSKLRLMTSSRMGVNPPQAKKRTLTRQDERENQQEKKGEGWVEETG